MTFTEFLNFISQDENHFVGFLFVLTPILLVVKVIFKNLINAITIWIRGYPPLHCNINGKSRDVDLVMDDEDE